MESTFTTASAVLAAALALGCVHGKPVPGAAPAIVDAGSDVTVTHEAGSGPVVPHTFGSGPVWPFTVNGTDAGFSPNIWFSGSGPGGGLIADGSAPSFSLYVNKGGNDANPCSILSPCLTIGRGMSVMKSLQLNVFQNGVVHLGVGSYIENWLLPPGVIVKGEIATDLAPVILGTTGLDSAAWAAANTGFSDASPPAPQSGIESVELAYGYAVTIDFTGAASSATSGEVDLTYALIGGPVTITGDPTQGGFVLAENSRFDPTSTITVQGGAQLNTITSNVTSPTVAITGAQWQSQGDSIGTIADSELVSITVDSTSGAASITGTGSQTVGSLTLKGPATTCSGTAGFIPSSVTLTPYDGGTPAPCVPLSPVMGLSSIIPMDGGPATAGLVATATGNGGVVFSSAGQTIEAGASGQIYEMAGSSQTWESMSGDCTNASGGAVTCSIPLSHTVACTAAQIVQANSTPANACATVSGDCSMAVGGALSCSIGATHLVPGTADQLLDTNHAGTAAEWFTSSGDVALSSHVMTVGSLKGNTFNPGTGSLTKGDFLMAATTGSIDNFAASGDFTCSASTVGQCTVAKVNGVSYGAGGSLTSGYVPVVTGSSATTYGLLPATSIAACTAGQVVGANSAPATECITIGGDVTPSATTQLNLIVNEAQSGELLFGASTGTITAATGATAAGIVQTGESSAIKGADMVFTSQPSTHATDNGSGNFVFGFGAPAGAGVESVLEVLRANTPIAAIGMDPDYSTVSAIWLAPSFAHTHAAATIAADGVASRFNGIYYSELSVSGNPGVVVTGADVSIDPANVALMSFGTGGSAWVLSTNSSAISLASTPVTVSATNLLLPYLQFNGALGTNPTVVQLPANVPGFWVMDISAVTGTTNDAIEFRLGASGNYCQTLAGALTVANDMVIVHTDGTLITCGVL